MSREHIAGSVHRQNAVFATLVGLAKRFEAYILKPRYFTDTLYLRVAQMPRSPDMPDLAIFVLYSRASDNGPSEKRTTSLQRTSAV